MQAHHPTREIAKGLALVAVGVALLLALLFSASRFLHPGPAGTGAFLMATAYANGAVQCRGTNRDGSRCKNRTTNDPPYCRYRRGQAPKDPSELPR